MSSVLAIAYACEPEEGSEPGAGWMWARMLSTCGDTWVITRSNNRESIEAGLRDTPAPRLHFVYVDLPKWARVWKRGTQGIRTYYLLWQLLAAVAARRLQAQHHFDAVWHLTLANIWLGSIGSLVGAPFIYGPVGGGVSVPRPLRPLLGLRGRIQEGSRSCIRLVFRMLNPLARVSWRRASVILVQNDESKQWIPSRYRNKVEVRPNPVLLDQSVSGGVPDARPQKLLFAGRLLPWKGTRLALSCLPYLEDWELIICGDGPDSPRLHSIARDLNVAERVDFRGWLSRSELQLLMRTEARLLLCPSLREEAGWVVIEALAAGLPVVSLDIGGPPILAGDAGTRIPVGRPSEVVRGLVSAVDDAVSSQMAIDRARQFAESARRHEVCSLLKRVEDQIT